MRQRLKFSRFEINSCSISLVLLPLISSLSFSCYVHIHTAIYELPMVKSAVFISLSLVLFHKFWHANCLSEKLKKREPPKTSLYCSQANLMRKCSCITNGKELYNDSLMLSLFKSLSVHAALPQFVVIYPFFEAEPCCQFHVCFFNQNRATCE